MARPGQTRAELQSSLEGLQECEQLASLIGVEFDDTDVQLTDALSVLCSRRRRASRGQQQPQQPQPGTARGSVSTVGPQTLAAQTAAAQLRSTPDTLSVAATSAAQVNARATVAMLRKRGKPVPASLLRESGEP